MTATTFDPLRRSRYVALTTFRRDGTPVSTPVWLAEDGDALVVITGTGAGKVRRIRANPSVTLAPCDIRGRVHGDAVAGRATVLAPEETHRITGLIRRRYGFVGWLFSRGDASGRVALSISPV